VSRLALLTQRRALGLIVDADLDTLATALYVRVDDLLTTRPERGPWRPEVGIAPKITDAELVTLAVMAAARVHQRGPLAALRPRAVAFAVSVPAPTAWL
jgi:hypothetical protein